MRRLKPFILLIFFAPLAWLIWRWTHNQLGFNRIETVARFTGDWTIRFLLASLVITPLRHLRPQWNGLLEYRRPLGLFAFFYGTLHFGHYLALDKLWDWNEVWTDFTLRRFFIAGLLAWAVMIPLAATSFNKAIQWMGGKNWQRLHRLAYFSAFAGVAHFYWQGKAAMLDPVIYAVIFWVLMAYRGWLWWQKRRNRAARLRTRPV